MPIHGSVEDTKLSTNKQHTLSLDERDEKTQEEMLMSELDRGP